MFRTLPLVFALLLAAVSARADRPRSPFGVSVTAVTNAGIPAARVSFELPPQCVLYAERLRFETEDETQLSPSAIPAPVLKPDPVSGQEKPIYERSFSADVSHLNGMPSNLVVRFQGCTNAACFFPDRRAFSLLPNGRFVESIAAGTSETTSTNTGAWSSMAEGFRVASRGTGYLNAKEFVDFLDRSATQQSEGDNSALHGMGIWASLLFILLGGAGLNLTPCVLPLIPINLALIGAGSRARSRREGFMHGAVYGAGMALAYGGLGLVVVLTGAKFGTLNSSVWFNAVIALLFVVMAVAMFDVVSIDISRWGERLGVRQGGGGASASGRMLAVFGLGAFAALLAGACVAPVVISVLLLSTDLYGRGMVWGLVLPFLLGLGMALPWPFAGAGLAFLPKPGRWMSRVKQGFGVLILLFAAYYAHTAYGLTRPAGPASDGGPQAHAPAEDANQMLTRALHRGLEEKRPVFLDFQASWCKDCVAMDSTVFNREEVQKRLQGFIVVKYPAEHPNESPAREVLDRFGVLGLPTYLVLVPKL
jgi:thiol:disulfide interchange protein